MVSEACFLYAFAASSVLFSPALAAGLKGTGYLGLHSVYEIRSGTGSGTQLSSDAGRKA